jgi:hypothetical protein
MDRVTANQGFQVAFPRGFRIDARSLKDLYSSQKLRGGGPLSQHQLPDFRELPNGAVQKFSIIEDRG